LDHAPELRIFGTVVTIIGLLAGVKRMLEQRCNPRKGGEGDRSQGCADPRGRTWKED
jgi:hypothetical protein